MARIHTERALGDVEVIAGGLQPDSAAAGEQCEGRCQVGAEQLGKGIDLIRVGTILEWKLLVVATDPDAALLGTAKDICYGRVKRL